MMTRMDSRYKMYWSNGATQMRNRILGKRKAKRLEMEVVKRINTAVGELAKSHKDDPTLHEPSDCAQWQWDNLWIEEETED